MAFRPYSIDDNIIPSGGGSAQLPEGVYLWEIVSVKPHQDKADYAGESYHALKAIARDGNPAGVGLSVTKNLFMTDAAMWVLGAFCDTLGTDFAVVQKLGKSVKTYASHAALAAALSSKWAGKMFTCGVQDRDYTTSGGNTGTSSDFVMGSLMPASAFKAAPTYAGVAAPGSKKVAAADDDDEEEEEDLETRFKAVIGDDDDDDEEEEEEDDDDDEDDDDEDDEEDDEDEEDEEPAPRRGRPAAPAPAARRARR